MTNNTWVPESTNWDGEKKVSHGKYAGNKWSQLPQDELKRYLNTTFGHFRDQVSYELHRRKHEQT